MHIFLLDTYIDYRNGYSFTLSHIYLKYFSYPVLTAGRAIDLIPIESASFKQLWTTNVNYFKNNLVMNSY